VEAEQVERHKESTLHLKKKYKIGGGVKCRVLRGSGNWGSSSSAEKKSCLGYREQTGYLQKCSRELELKSPDRGT